MKTSLAIKTLFRTPGKTLFTFLLIAVLTFSLFIQLAEYIKTSAEFKENVAMYKGTGYVEVQPAVYKGPALHYPYYIETDPRVNAVNTPRLQEFAYPALSAEAVDEISRLPYISSVQKRYMTAGVSGDYQRVREDTTRYDYNGRIILEGTLSRKDALIANYFGPYYALSDVKILAGDTQMKELQDDDGTVYFDASYFEWDFDDHPEDEWLPGVSAEDVVSDRLDDPWPSRGFYFSNYPYNKEFQESLRLGDRYVFVCRFERHAANRIIATVAYNVTQQSLRLYDWVTEHFCPAVWNITDAPENYLELPDYAPLNKLIEITETDLYTFDTVYAGDMTAIKQIHENTLQIKEGRWLNQADTDTNAKVCVIDESIAYRNGLKLGDTLSLRLGNALFEQFYSLGAIASTEERFADRWTEDEFEIVGVYAGSSLMKDANEPNWAYSMNTVFVPLASLPLTEDELAGHEFHPGELTFRVDNAWDIAAFLEESAPRIEAMGLSLMFDDGGWPEVLEAYRLAQKLPLIRIALLAFVTVTGLALSVYLFVSRKKKDYAIMRALGTPKGRSGRALLVPITVLSLAAVLFGIGAGAVYSLLVLGGVSALPAAICLGGELVFTLLFTGLNIRKLSKLPPLTLLQGSGSRAQKARRATGKKQPETIQGTLYVPTNMKLNTEPLPITRRPASPGFILDYIWRHIRRQGVKSVLAVLLAALMVGAVVQFASLRDTYNTLRENTPVPVNFTKVLSLDKLQFLEDEGFTKDVYYERLTHLRCMSGLDYYVETQVVITSDIDRFLGNEAYEIVLGDGYSMEDLGKRDYVLLSSDLMEKYGLQPHDTVRFGMKDDIEKLLMKYRSNYIYYHGTFLGEDVSGVTLKDVYASMKEKMDKAFSVNLAEAEVIGTIQAASGAYKNTAFTAGINHAASIIGSTQSIDAVEFTLADNSRAEELRQRGGELSYGRSDAFAMDTARLESVIRTSDLMNSLYPAVVVLALLIGAAMCVLLVMQNTKDAAIMRALGTTKRTTRAMLAVEQILLGVIGVIAGICVMLAIKRGALVTIALQAGLFAAAYALVLVLGSYASAALATKKNILELLQTKE